MSFTDDDLKRLKEALETLQHVFHAYKLRGMIARLEEAENGFTEYHGLEMSKGCKCRCCKSWRKAAGK